MGVLVGSTGQHEPRRASRLPLDCSRRHCVCLRVVASAQSSLNCAWRGSALCRVQRSSRDLCSEYLQRFAVVPEWRCTAERSDTLRNASCGGVLGATRLRYGRSSGRGKRLSLIPAGASHRSRLPCHFWVGIVGAFPLVTLAAGLSFLTAQRRKADFRKCRATVDSLKEELEQIKRQISSGSKGLLKF